MFPIYTALAKHKFFSPILLEPNDTGKLELNRSGKVAAITVLGDGGLAFASLVILILGASSVLPSDAVNAMLALEAALGTSWAILYAADKRFPLGAPSLVRAFLSPPQEETIQDETAACCCQYSTSSYSV